MAKRKVLWVDDGEALAKMSGALERELGDGFEVVPWNGVGESSPKPSSDQPAGPLGHLERHFDWPNMAFVVTDYDLTKGSGGLYGSAIVGWCRSRAIPVATYSMGLESGVPRAPDLFDITIPGSNRQAAVKTVSRLVRGFEAIRSQLTEEWEQLGAQTLGPRELLAHLLGEAVPPHSLAPYFSTLGDAGAALRDSFQRSPERANRYVQATYVVGHVLLNAVLQFPGPVMNTAALLAYVACGEASRREVERTFQSARYSGPFSDGDSYFRLVAVDEVLEPLLARLDPNLDVETAGEMHRKAIELEVGKSLQPPMACDRCDGKNGGYYCPFTERPVCHRNDCSVGASPWIPQGATLCRVERDYYDEWAPILGV